jgi:hypothetical protein
MTPIFRGHKANWAELHRDWNIMWRSGESCPPEGVLVPR